MVFRTISEVDHFSRAIPDITKIEFLSQVTSGIGTRFRETRLMKGREATTTLEITECVPPEKIRFVADSHGTVWDSVYTLAPAGEDALLTLSMEARPHTLLARVITPLIRGMVQKALESDMDRVKEWCEKGA
jgi:hypothetical protein